MKKSVRPQLLLGLGLLLLASACTAKADLWLEDGPGGKFSLDLQVAPALRLYFKDLEELDPAFKQGILNPAAIAASLAEQKALRQTKVTAPTTESLALSGKITDLPSLAGPAAGKKGRPLFTLTEKDGTKLVSVYLDRANLRQLLSGTALAQSKALSVLIPKAEAPLTKAEYRELIAYMLEPYDDKIAGVLDKASLDLSLHLPAPVKKAAKGTVKGDTVTWNLPLLTVFTLEQPLTLEVSY